MVLKSIVCLANSVKQGANCVAGIELVNGWPADWVRPIGTDPGHGVTAQERELAGGGEPLPLDILRVALSGPSPWGHQGENWSLDTSVAWQKTGTWAYDDLDDLADTPARLWDAESSTVGLRDRVPAESLVASGESIYLVRAEQPEVHVVRNPFNGAIEVRAFFGYADEQHLIKISDPVYRASYRGEGLGNYKLPEAYLTVSLAEPWSAKPAQPQYAYLVAAAIIEPDGPPGSNR